jgi:adenine phosphoribosyltransferase
MQLSESDRKQIIAAIREIPDFPIKGVVFKDITTLLADKDAFHLLMQHLYNRYKTYGLNFVAGIDARGFIFGAALAQMLGTGFVPIRKKGKLPHETHAEQYALEYGFDELEIHVDAFDGVKDPKVLLVDDLLATGGTALAAANLVKKSGGNCVEACFILGLEFLEGKSQLESVTDVYTVIGIN